MALNINQESKMNLDPLNSQTQIFKILTHPARIAILNILRDGEHCVCHMEAFLGLRQAYISQQLAVLREAGLIEDRRDGWNVFYRVVEPQIYAVINAVEQMGVPGDSISAVHEGFVCDCPKCRSRSEEK